jgi:hypothetical protein
VLATNFGIIISEDGGASWLWSCERPETSFGYLYSVGSRAARSHLRSRTWRAERRRGWLAYSDDGSCTWHTRPAARWRTWS